MKIAGLIQDSIVDGPGFRFAVYVQGCKMQCDGCHNPETWDIGGGVEMPVEDIIDQMLKNPLTDGLTLSGGEPFLQAADCARLAAAAREHGLNVWVFSGYKFENLSAAEDDNMPDRSKLLELTDVLVDGPYIAQYRSLSLKWRGSKNQRILDIPKSIAAGRAVVLL